jgi:hypothetical protein
MCCLSDRRHGAVSCGRQRSYVSVLTGTQSSGRKQKARAQPVPRGVCGQSIYVPQERPQVYFLLIKTDNLNIERRNKQIQTNYAVSSPTERPSPGGEFQCQLLRIEGCRVVSPAEPPRQHSAYIRGNACGYVGRVETAR